MLHSNFEKASNAYKAGYNASYAGRADAAAQHLEQALALFRIAMLEGNSKALLGIGASSRINRNLDCKKYAKLYFKAAALCDNAPRAWLQLGEINLLEKSWNIMQTQCYLALAWQHALKDNTRLLSSIEDSAEELKGNFSPASMAPTLNELDRLWALLPPFWVVRYRSCAVTQPKLEACWSCDTQTRFATYPNSESDFKEKAGSWCALWNHFNWTPRPFYLVYIANAFNQEMIPLIHDTLQLCGYETHLIEWSQVDKTIFPQESVLAILSDISFFIAPNEVTQARYERMQKHSGIKLWIPWQIPADMALPGHWRSLSTYWSSWLPLPISLLEEPLDFLLSAYGIRGYVFPEIKNISTEEITAFFKNKTTNTQPKIANTNTTPLATSPSLFGDASVFTTLSTPRNADDIQNTEQLAESLRVTDHNDHRYKTLQRLALNVLERFARRRIKTNEYIQEVVHLAYSKNHEVINHLLKFFVQTFHEQVDPEIALMEGLVLVIAQAESSQLEPNTLVQILRKLMTRLSETHIQTDNEKFAYHMLRVINALLAAMRDGNITQPKSVEDANKDNTHVSDVPWEKFRGEYYTQLDNLKVSPRFRIEVECAKQALVRIAHDKTTFSTTLTHVVYLVTSISIISSIVMQPHHCASISDAYTYFSRGIQYTDRCKKWYDELRFAQLLVRKNLMQQCEYFLRFTATSKKDNAFVLGIAHILDDFIRLPYVLPDSKIAAVKLMTEILQQNEIWSSHNEEVTPYFLACLQAYAKAEAIYPNLALAARQSILQLEQKFSSIPPNGESIGKKVHRYWCSLFEATQPTTEFLVPPLTPTLENSTQLLQEARLKQKQLTMSTEKSSAFS